MMQIRYLWGLRYVDDLVFRERDAKEISSGSINERLYALHDTNWNIVAMGTPNEHFTYNAFGKVNCFNSAWGAKSAPAYTSRLFTGQELDAETGLMLYRNRVYHPTLGRFVQRDPIGYSAGDVSLYRYVWNMPIVYIDTLGLVSPAIIRLPPVVIGGPSTESTPPLIPGELRPQPRSTPPLIPGELRPQPRSTPPLIPGELRPQPGLTPSPTKSTFYLESGFVNCLGYACGYKMSMQLEAHSSMDDVLKNLGYSCTTGISAAACPDHCSKLAQNKKCKCTREIVVYIYLQNRSDDPDYYKNLMETTKGKDFWKMPSCNINWNTVDFHGIHHKGSGVYDEVSGRYPAFLDNGTPNPDAASHDVPPKPRADYFGPHQLIVGACCCRLTPEK